MQKFYLRLILILLSTFLLWTAKAIAQTRCSTMEAERERVQDSRHLPGNEFFESWLRMKIEEQRNQLVPFGPTDDGDPLLIPVVVHVIHRGETYGVGLNIIDEQIFSQIEVLNEDFQRKNADTLDTQEDFLPVASKINLEFVLARQDENGLPTRGIVRTQGEKNAYNTTIRDRELLSSYSHWNPEIYLNIWVTDLVGSNLGLAQFPDYGESDAPDGLPGLDDKPNKDNALTDGLLIDYRVFGSADKVPGLDLMSQYDKGRTATHEIGHFFGLLHTWGDGGCSVDDFVFDTPNSNETYLGDCAPDLHFSCGSNDMFENYMYYTDDGCMNTFSNGQVARMEVILANAPRRATLVNSIGAEFPQDISFDLSINAITSPGKVLCDADIVPVIEIKNNGRDEVDDFDILVTLNGTPYRFAYEGDAIGSGALVQVQLETLSASFGSNSLVVELTGIPLDTDASNNIASHVFAVDIQTDFVPLREQFAVTALDQTNWIALDDDDNIGWEMVHESYDEGSRSMAIALYEYEARGETDWLISPLLDLQWVSEASMTFKASYAGNLDYDDELQIMISENCDGYFRTTLETYSSIELSVRNTTDPWFPQDRSDWKEHSLDLTAYAGRQDVRLAFKTVNGSGNNLYIDDIEFFTVADDQRVAAAENSFTLYPNPAENGHFQLTFNTSERQEVAVHIYDQLGKQITMRSFPNTLNQTYSFDLENQSRGVYFIQARGKDFYRVKKLLLHD
jgi:hypothetical protein